MQKFEDAQEKELLTDGLAEAFAKWTREQKASKWRDQKAHCSDCFCEGPNRQEGRGGIVWASWNRTGSADFVKGRRVNMFPF